MTETREHERRQWLAAMDKGKPFPSDEYKIRALINDADRLQGAEALLRSTRDTLQAALDDGGIQRDDPWPVADTIAKLDAYFGERHD